ncbi:MAG TPA: ring-cleaving dioxygenase [Gemmatimonadales bacterium]|nr:ring-cleaving dioxygenase [Gemmatimonadales bacterium]
MSQLTGIHHVTAIAGDAQENLDFYAGILGMRLVKRSVNQDAPDTYHLFYADAEGHPGSDLTFFPWPGMAPARPGTGLSQEVALAVPADSLGYWSDRLTRYGAAMGAPEVRFGNQALPLTDPHGLPLALVASDDLREFTAWDRSPVPEPHQIRGLHGVRLWQRDLTRTAEFFTSALGFRPLGQDGEWHRFGVRDGGSGQAVEIRELPLMARGAWGTGGIHHVAWRVPDQETELAVRARVEEAGRRPTMVIDRFWFRSVYFTEPGGALQEIATDGPGFAADEPPEALGEKLVLPPWLEADRAAIEAELPPLRAPVATPA